MSYPVSRDKPVNTSVIISFHKYKADYRPFNIRCRSAVCSTGSPAYLLEQVRTRTHGNRSKLNHLKCFLDHNVTFCTYITSLSHKFSKLTVSIRIYFVSDSKYHTIANCLCSPILQLVLITTNQATTVVIT